MPTADITVLFTTRNGEHVLERTLEGYCRVEPPSCPWKLVIVDNGSDDLTPTILKYFKQRLPLEILQFPAAGQNRARNYGLGALEGHLALITDDDAVPDTSFLLEWSRYLNERQDYEIFGGSIDLLFEVPPPQWVLRNKSHFELLYAYRDLPEGPIPPEAIFGPNMAVRSSVFAKRFRFDENMGPSASDPDYPMGAETEFYRRVARDGAKAWFAKRPLVQHIVRRSQVSRSFWARRFYRHGRGIAKQMWENRQDPPPYISRPLPVDYAWRLYHRIRMLSPLPLQRIRSVQAYYWKQGFSDEWSSRKSVKK